MKPRILYLCPHLPTEPAGGSDLLQIALVKHASEHLDVDLVSTLPGGMTSPTESPVHRYARRVYAAPYDRNWSYGVRLASKLRMGKPELWQAWNCPSAVRMLQAVMKSEHYDTAVIDQPYVCGGAWRSYIGGMPALHIVQDILEDICLAKSDLRSARAVGRCERASWARADACWAFIESNAARAREECRRVILSPLGYELDDAMAPGPVPGDKRILFVGSLGYGPNHAGVQWFLEAVFPSVLARHPDAQLTIVGRGTPPDTCSMRNVTVCTDVQSVLPYYQSSRLVVVPIPYGSGFRVKVVEAMFMHRPMVSTSVGCEGIGLQDGEHILIADDPDRFAEHTAVLLDDSSLCTRLADKALDMAMEKFTWEKTLAPVTEELLRLAADGRKGR